MAFNEEYYVDENTSLDEADCAIEYNGVSFTNPYILCIELMKEFSVNPSAEAILAVPLNKITKKYLDIIQVHSVNGAGIGKFIDLALKLLKLKISCIMPPKPDYEDDEESAEEILYTENKIKAKLKVYLNDLTTTIKPYEVVGQIQREPMYSVDEYKEVVKDFDFSLLLEAYQRVLEHKSLGSPKKKALPVKVLRVEKFTVEEKIKEIRERLTKVTEMAFEDIFADDTSKEEVINSFLAVLEMFKHQALKLLVKDNEYFVTINTDFTENKEEIIKSEYDEN